MNLFFTLILQLLLSNIVNTAAGPASDHKFPYDLTEPDKELKLPKKLLEISGLSTFNQDPNYLLGVQDENGVIFFVNRESGRVDREVRFWKDGDYEGIEMVNTDIFVVKSTGTIYQVSNYDEEVPVVTKFNFFLNSENDIEGLGYDPVNHRLLLACKAKAAEGDEYRFKKGIYAFDLASKTMPEKPVILITQDEIHDYLGTAPQIRKLDKVVEFFNSNFAFSPSGLAIHPFTGNIYISSSVGKLLLVVSPEGQVLHIEKLSKKVHPQPEGICFDNNGNLYMANEGKSGDGMIYRFDYAPVR